MWEVRAKIGICESVILEGFVNDVCFEHFCGKLLLEETVTNADLGFSAHVSH